MPLRHTLAVVSLAAVAAAPLPALARDDGPADMARRLSDPGTQAAVTIALTALSEAMLDLKIEPFRRALGAMGDESVDDLPPDARLRDLAGPEASGLPAEIGRRVPQAMGAVAGMAGALEDLMPQLEDMAKRMKGALPPQ